MWYWLRSPQTADVVIVVAITAATLTHGYAPDICKQLDCMYTIQYFEVAMMTGMVAASGILLFRAFKYRNVKHSTVRNRHTIIVVCAASMHTVVFNLCQWYVGTCHQSFSIVTPMLLVCIGLVLVKPSVMLPTGVGARAADRNYYEDMIDDRVVVFVYWSIMVVGLWYVWMLDVVVWLFEPEILTMLVVGLFGPLIALYFANHERNRRIEENVFYKILVLSHIQTIIHIVTARAHKRLVADAKDAGIETHVVDQTGDLTTEWRDERIRIHATNTNTYVPAYVRGLLSNILLVSDSLFLPNNRMGVDTKHLLGELGTLINFPYFTDDRDPTVRKTLSYVKHSVHSAKELIAKP